jgi:hypothetical protein
VTFVISYVLIAVVVPKPVRFRPDDQLRVDVPSARRVDAEWEGHPFFRIKELQVVDDKPHLLLIGHAEAERHRCGRATMLPVGDNVPLFWQERNSALK